MSVEDIPTAQPRLQGTVENLGDLKGNGGEYRNRTGVHGFAIQPDIQRNQRGFVSKHPQTEHEHNAKVSNPDLRAETKNPGAAATATGANSIDEATKLPRKDSTSEAPNATRLTLFDKSCIAFFALRELPRDHARIIAEEALASGRIPGETPQMTAAIAQAAQEYRRSRDRRAL